jgi:hypothetical protein
MRECKEEEHEEREGRGEEVEGNIKRKGKNIHSYHKHSQNSRSPQK